MSGCVCAGKASSLAEATAENITKAVNNSALPSGTSGWRESPKLWNKGSYRRPRRSYERSAYFLLRFPRSLAELAETF